MGANTSLTSNFSRCGPQNKTRKEERRDLELTHLEPTGLLKEYWTAANDDDKTTEVPDDCADEKRRKEKRKKKCDEKTSRAVLGGL